MQQPHQATGIADRLLPPQHRLLVSRAVVLGREAVLCHPVALVYRRYGKHQQQRQRRAGDKGKQLGLGQRIDIVHLQRGRHAELVDERRQKLGIRLEGDKGRGCGGRIGVRDAGHDGEERVYQSGNISQKIPGKAYYPYDAKDKKMDAGAKFAGSCFAFCGVAPGAACLMTSAGAKLQLW